MSDEPTAPEAEPEVETAKPEVETAKPEAKAPEAKAPEAKAPEAKPPEAPKVPRAPDKKVTASLLKAAARTPEEIKDVLMAEARQRKRRRQPSSVFALAMEDKDEDEDVQAKKAASDSKRTRSSATKRAGAATKPRVAAAPPRAMPPVPQPAGPVPRASAPAPASAAAPRAASPRPTSARAPAPPSAPASPPPRAAAPPTGRAAPLSVPPPAAPAAAPSGSGPTLLLAAAVLLSGATVAWGLRGQSTAVNELAQRAGTPPPVQVLPPPVASGEGPRAAALAELGGGRAVYTAPGGELVVLRRDPTSGELEIERVYELVQDPGRHQGQGTRRFHGYYLDDVEVRRREAVRQATDRYEAAVTKAQSNFGQGVPEADAAAIELARLGGAARLMTQLGPEASALRRRTAVVGLAENRYLGACRPLLGLMRDHVRNPEFFAYLCRLMTRLTALELTPIDPQAALEKTEAWLQTNPVKDRYARVP